MIELNKSMGKMIKDPKKLEAVIKGFANYRRIQILYLLNRQRDLSNNDIAEQLHIGFRSSSQHLDKMYRGGLLGKTKQGPLVIHSLTTLGKQALDFLNRFERY